MILIHKYYYRPDTDVSKSWGIWRNNYNGTTNNDYYISSAMEDIRNTRTHLFTNIGRAIYPGNLDSFTSNCYGNLGANRDIIFYRFSRV